MADVIIQIYGIRTTEDARMVVEQGSASYRESPMGKSKELQGSLHVSRQNRF